MPQRNGHMTHGHGRTPTKSASHNGTLSSAIEAGTEKAQAAMKTINDAAHQVSERATTAKESVVSFIEERPLTSVMIAAGVGALAARLFGSLRR